MKKLPIGISEFSEIVKGNYYYVDKTLLIKDIIDLPGKVKLITRPRRFGKTLNMRMLEQFFSLEGEEGLFDELEIWKKQGIVKDYYHKYPVVFITFKDIKDTTWKEAKESLKGKLSELAKKHLDAIKDDVGIKANIISVAQEAANDKDYKNFLRYLTQALYEAIGKKVFLLIDEYDVPIESAYTYKDKGEDYYDNMVAFMRNLLTAALKDNEYLEFGILTGVYRVAKESIFSGLNNLHVFTIFENAMTDKFGFTEEEVTEMLEYYNLDAKEDKETVKNWYDSYKVGNLSDLYNPWSILNYISNRLTGFQPKEAAQPYWTNTSSNDMIIKQIETNPAVKETIEELLKGEEVIVPLDPWLSLRELEDDPNGVWTLFASSGYISASRIEQDIYSVKIPNRELERFFKRTVMLWLSKLTKTNLPDMYKYLYFMLREGKYIDKFIKKLQGFIVNSMSYHDFAKEPEGVYKGFLLGMLSIAQSGYKVESEVESGYGRLDVVIYPKEKGYGKYAAIFEVKRADDEGKLEEKAKEALKQIKERKYYTRMKSLGYKVIGFGIAFSGKKAYIESEIF